MLSQNSAARILKIGLSVNRSTNQNVNNGAAKTESDQVLSLPSPVPAVQTIKEEGQVPSSYRYLPTADRLLLDNRA